MEFWGVLFDDIFFEGVVGVRGFFGDFSWFFWMFRFIFDKDFVLGIVIYFEV